MIIAFEGGEGAGKGTQIGLLEKALVAKGHKVLCIKEPGGTKLGALLREALLHKQDLSLFGVTEAFLFSASRAQQIREVVEPAVKSKTIVLSDRSFYSTYAYQVYGRGMNLKSVSALTEIAVGKYKPDLVIYLDIDPKVGLARKTEQNEVNRMEKEALEFHNKVREGYLKLAKQNKSRWLTVDATLTPEQIHEVILSKICLEFGY